MSRSTARMKRAARAIKSIARDMETVAGYHLMGTSEKVPESFEGRTANALEDRLMEIAVSINGIARSLEGNAGEIMDYAWWLESLEDD